MLLALKVGIHSQVHGEVSRNLDSEMLGLQILSLRIDRSTPEPAFQTSRLPQDHCMHLLPDKGNISACNGQ